MLDYSRRNLKCGEMYMETLAEGSAARTFCEIPLALAQATVAVIGGGGLKLTREQVMQICKLKV